MKATAAFLLVLCHLAISHAFKCRFGPKLKDAWQIDAGQGQVVARDKNSNAFFLSGKHWCSLGTTKLQHVSVGQAGIWAVDSKYNVYKYVSGNWENMAGAQLIQVDAGQPYPGGSNHLNYVFCLKSDIALKFSAGPTTPWTRLSGATTYTSCGPYGCWGVGMDSQAWFMKTTSCENTSWTHVPGLQLKTIETGADGSVFALTKDGLIHQRTGISKKVPQGTKWVKSPIKQKMTSVSTDLNRLWAVTTTGTVLYCTL